jgi:hypothetical protein
MYIAMFVAVIGAGIVIALYWRERTRAVEFRTLAAREGLHYLGGALPRSLNLSGTPLQALAKVWNVMDGAYNGTRIIVFDCQIGTGKVSWRRTVFAIETDSDVFGTYIFNADFDLDRAGKWVLAYRPRSFVPFASGLMPVGELQAHLNAVAAYSDSNAT